MLRVIACGEHNREVVDAHDGRRLFYFTWGSWRATMYCIWNPHKDDGITCYDLYNTPQININDPVFAHLAAHNMFAKDVTSAATRALVRLEVARRERLRRGR